MSLDRLPAGVWPVMLTAFHDDGSIDWEGVDALTDWYIASGVAGLFSVCLSSEMYELTADEKVCLAERVVGRAAGRVPVVASGAFIGATTEEQAASVRRMAGTGAAAVVVITNALAGEGEDDRVWRTNAERLLALTGDIPLGLYECPRPYRRSLSPELMDWAGATGRFRFHKDTCCRIESIREKIAATRGTALRFFNAHTPTLLESLRAGGDGYSGIGANFCPGLYVRLCRDFRTHPAHSEAEAIERVLTEFDASIFKYPASAKLFLAEKGLPIGTRCRTQDIRFDEMDREKLGRLRDLVQPLGEP